jgi:hypothetical protein
MVYGDKHRFVAERLPQAFRVSMQLPLTRTKIKTSAEQLAVAAV